MRHDNNVNNKLYGPRIIGFKSAQHVSIAHPDIYYYILYATHMHTEGSDGQKVPIIQYIYHSVVIAWNAQNIFFQFFHCRSSLHANQKSDSVAIENRNSSVVITYNNNIVCY